MDTADSIIGNTCVYSLIASENYDSSPKLQQMQWKWTLKYGNTLSHRYCGVGILRVAFIGRDRI